MLLSSPNNMRLECFKSGFSVPFVAKVVILWVHSQLGNNLSHAKQSKFTRLGPALSWYNLVLPSSTYTPHNTKWIFIFFFPDVVGKTRNEVISSSITEQVQALRHLASVMPSWTHHEGAKSKMLNFLHDLLSILSDLVSSSQVENDRSKLGKSEIVCNIVIILCRSIYIGFGLLNNGGNWKIITRCYLKMFVYCLEKTITFLHGNCLSSDHFQTIAEEIIILIRYDCYWSIMYVFIV